jgi:tetraacyldisaccharide 4'-kinase
VKATGVRRHTVNLSIIRPIVKRRRGDFARILRTPPGFALTRPAPRCYSPPSEGGRGTRINPETWYALIRGERRGPLAAAARAGLRVASWPYGLGAWARNRLFDRGWNRVNRAPVPVVSVGNLTLGGTGKTPCVEWVARFYRERGVQVAIVSRGYGSEGGRNDEAMVLEENLPDVPHLQDPDRFAAARRAAEELESELIVLDDGFQHRRLHRDLDIALIDATHPPARDYLFPRGTLREPASGLRRAGAILLTRCDQVPPGEVNAIRAWLARRWPQTPVATTEHRPVALVRGEGESGPAEALAGKAVGAFCGIGNPAAFRRTLEAMGAAVADFRAYPDHHGYARADVDELTRWAGTLPAGSIIATTQKDWVKLRVSELAGRPLWAVRIGLTFRDGESDFAAVVEKVLPK